MDSSNSLDKISESLSDRATVRTIFGDPVETHGKTIIPVARVAYGFGGGHGHGHGKGKSDGQMTQEEDGEGEGAGGGMMVMPKGVLEISDDSTRFVPLVPSRKLFAAAVIGMMFGMIIGGRKAKKKYKH